MVQDLAVQFVEVDAQTVLQLRESAFRLDRTVDPMIYSRIAENICLRLHPVLLKCRGELETFLCGVRMISRLDAR